MHLKYNQGVQGATGDLFHGILLWQPYQNGYFTGGSPWLEMNGVRYRYWFDKQQC